MYNYIQDLDKTYGNPCQAHCERTEAELLDCYYGECPACACAMIFAPTCCGGKVELYKIHIFCVYINQQTQNELIKQKHKKNKNKKIKNDWNK